MKRFSAIIQHTAGDKHSLVVSSWNTDTDGSKINIESHNKTHDDITRALSSMRNFIESRRTPETTSPTLTPYAVVIPEVYQWAFPQDKFILGGFEIPLDTHNNDKVVNIAYFMWEEFRAELDSGKYEDLKRALMGLWDYVALQADTIGPWMQDPQNNALSDKVVIL